MTTYTGSCHCGNTRYTVEGEIDQVIDCNCSYCIRRGHLLWFVPRNKLKLETDASALKQYFFNKHVIAHQFCPNCGIGPFGFAKNKEGVDTAAINVRCLENVDLGQLKVVPFDGRSR